MPAEEPACQGCAAALPLLREAGAALGRPVLVGIGGPGGSGKSSFALRISNLLDYPRFSAGAADESHLVLRRSRCGRHLIHHGR